MLCPVMRSLNFYARHKRAERRLRVNFLLPVDLEAGLDRVHVALAKAGASAINFRVDGIDHQADVFDGIPVEAQRQRSLFAARTCIHAISAESQFERAHPPFGDGTGRARAAELTG